MKERSNEDWLPALRASGEEQATAIPALRAYLPRAARYALHRPAPRTDTDRWQLAEDSAQEALLALLARLDTLRTFPAPQSIVQRRIVRHPGTF